ncbi:hypothetical protein COO60DRAFT_1176162 [Scenedesmus sp. NREL 46B-D3]|nr:hypothetical protein COO60DRAFT_1176162 [Scenedesmus sp. NREL 46B-D3]
MAAAMWQVCCLALRLMRLAASYLDQQQSQVGEKCNAVMHHNVTVTVMFFANTAATAHIAADRRQAMSHACICP